MAPHSSSCKVPVSFFFWTSLSLTPLPYTEAQTAILCPPDVKNWLTEKDPDAGKDWRQEEKGTTEDEMAGLHHWLNGHEFEQALGVGHGQGGQACCSPLCRRVRRDWATELIMLFLTGKNMFYYVIVMVPILIDKNVFKLSYNDLKLMVQNWNYICTNLIVSSIQLANILQVFVCV